MARYPQEEYVRVKDPNNGNEFTTSPGFAKSRKLDVLKDKRAVDRHGDPLPPKPNLNPPKKDSAPQGAASTNPTGGVSASKPEEGSK